MEENNFSFDWKTKDFSHFGQLYYCSSLANLDLSAVYIYPYREAPQAPGAFSDAGPAGGHEIPVAMPTFGELSVLAECTGDLAEIQNPCSLLRARFTMYVY